MRRKVATLSPLKVKRIPGICRRIAAAITMLLNRLFAQVNTAIASSEPPRRNVSQMPASSKSWFRMITQFRQWILCMPARISVQMPVGKTTAQPIPNTQNTVR